MLKAVTVRATLIALAAALSLSAHALADAPKKVDVPAGDLTTALETLAKQSGVEFVYSAEQLKGIHTNGVSGNFTPEKAVLKLLKGTKLKLTTHGSGALLISENNGPGTSTPLANTESEAVASSHTGEGSGDESKKSFWDRFRVAQMDQGKAAGDSSVERQEEQASKKKPIQLEEVVVTGSRIPTHTKEGPQEVKVYTQEKIDQSGQTTVSDFLNTLSDVSIAIREQGFQTSLGATTVRLHGLPIGTTLVLVNGRRLETSGSQARADFFDLNNIPTAIVEKIEVVPQGSSAIYGSDALAGVVNIILKDKFDGIRANAHYGSAPDFSEESADLTWGHTWTRGYLSIVGSYITNNEVDASKRAITATENYTAFGGPDTRLDSCNPGTVYSIDGSNLPGLASSFAAIAKGVQGKPTLSNFTAGQMNLCGLFTQFSLIPPSHRTSILATGGYDLTEETHAFVELLYSHVDENAYGGGYLLFSQTIPAANPFNPFGVDVNVDYAFPQRSSQFLHTDLIRPLVGLRGLIADRFNWEIAGWEARDHNYADQSDYIANNNALTAALASTDSSRAINLFAAGTPASQSVLSSILTSNQTVSTGLTEAFNGFIRGPLFTLPSGPVQAVVGAEHAHDGLSSNDAAYAALYGVGYQDSWDRNVTSVFGELRAPLVANPMHPGTGETLAVTGAVRHDNYSDFGGHTTPQYGVEWRPSEELLVRGSYAKAFRAPSLFQLFRLTNSFPGYPVTDPKNGGARAFVRYIYGGNPSLQLETGQSRSFGISWSPQQIQALQLSIEYWGVDQSNRVTQPNAQSLVNNEALFPGRVTRDSSGKITAVDTRYINFGTLEVSGFDFHLNYKYNSGWGTFTPSISATNVYKYLAVLAPGATPEDRVSKASQDAFSPRWKGTAAVGWGRGRYSANVDGRYVGRYQDYAPLTDGQYQQLGGFWLFDLNAKMRISGTRADESKESGAFLQLGAVNALNSLPRFSMFSGGYLGYDPAEYDIRGRFVYFNVSFGW